MLAGDGCGLDCMIEAGWTCLGAPSVCQRCGNGIAEGTELCDGMDIDGASCLESGLLAGAGGMVCLPGCDGFEDPATTCLGGAIDNVQALEEALTEAADTPHSEVLSIRGGNYVVGNTLQVEADDLTIQPMPGEVVRFYGQHIFTVEGEEVTLRGLGFVDVLRAVVVASDAKEAVIELNEVVSSTQTPSIIFEILGEEAVISANRVENLAGEGVAAIQITNVEDPTVRMNVISGPWQRAINLVTVMGEARIDQNSVWTTSGIGLSIDADRTSDNVCVRNNVIAGGAGSTGLELGTSTRFRACGGVATERNAVVGHGTVCTGRCVACTNGTVCDLMLDPMFVDGDLCPSPAMVDQGVDLGLDLVDGDPARFLGAAPELGAREAGTTRRFGGSDAICP